MATITQRLAFLISANAEQAIKAFDKTANSAEKQMRKAGNSIDKVGVQLTKFGAAGLAAAGTLGTGLFKLAQGAIEDQKSQALLAEQLRKTTGATDGQIKKVEELIDSTARATGFADDQLRPAYASLVRTFGDTEKASRVLSTALDLSRATGRDLETVTLALAKAASGSTGGLSRLGIVLDENTKKSKDFDQILKAVNDRVGGQAAKYADTYAGKLDRARIAISEAGESLGSAFVPVVEKSATAISTTINKLAELDQATGGAIGKFATFGTVGLGVISALSLIGGQTIKLRDRFTTLSDEGERSLNKLGQAAKYTGLTLAAVATSEAVFAFGNQLRDVAGKADRALQALNMTLEGTSAKAMVDSFAGLVKVKDDTWSLSKIFSDFGKEVKLAGTDSKRNIEDIDAAFSKLLTDSGPKAAQAVVDALRQQAAGLDTTSGQYADNMMLVERYQKRIDLLTGSQAALNKVNAEGAVNLSELKSQYQSFSSAILRVEERIKESNVQKLIDAQAERVRKEEERRAKAAADYAKQVDTLANKIETKLSKALSNAEQNAANANAAYKAYFDAIKGSVTGVVSLGDAQATAAANTQALADAKLAEAAAQENLNKVLGDPKADAEKVAEARQSLADATKAVAAAEQAPLTFADALSAQVAKASLFKNNLQQVLDLGADQTLVAQLAAAGADAGNAIIGGLLAATDPKAAVDALGQTVANVDALGAMIGKASADQFYGEGVNLANELLRGVSEQLAGIDLEKIKGGRNAVKNLKKLDKSLKNTPVDASLGLILGAQVPALADGGIVKASPGGTLALLGEGGRDEMVLPLPAKQPQATNVYVTVNAGLVSSPQQVGQQIIDAILRAQRVNGAVFVTV